MAKRKHANMYEDIDWAEYEYQAYPKALTVPEAFRAKEGEQVVVQNKEEHAAQFAEWKLEMPEEPKPKAEAPAPGKSLVLPPAGKPEKT